MILRGAIAPPGYEAEVAEHAKDIIAGAAFFLSSFSNFFLLRGFLETFDFLFVFKDVLLGK